VIPEIFIWLLIGAIPQNTPLYVPFSDL